MSGAALLKMVLLTGAHIGVIVTDRTLKVLTGKKQANGFGKTRHADEGTVLGRISCSYHNLIDNLPLFAAVVLTNRSFGGPDIAMLANYYFLCRLGQAAVHVTSVSSPAVTLRATFFFSSLILLGKMAVDTLFAIA